VGRDYSAMVFDPRREAVLLVTDKCPRRPPIPPPLAGGGGARGSVVVIGTPLPPARPGLRPRKPPREFAASARLRPGAGRPRFGETGPRRRDRGEHVGSAARYRLYPAPADPTPVAADRGKNWRIPMQRLRLASAIAPVRSRLAFTSGSERLPTHPTSPHQLLVCNLASARGSGKNRAGEGEGDKSLCGGGRVRRAGWPGQARP